MVLESKYNFGDSLWFLSDNGVKNLKVEVIRIESTQYKLNRTETVIRYGFFENSEKFYSTKCYIKKENELFETKEELIKTL